MLGTGRPVDQGFDKPSTCIARRSTGVGACVSRAGKFTRVPAAGDRPLQRRRARRQIPAVDGQSVGEPGALYHNTTAVCVRRWPVGWFCSRMSRRANRANDPAMKAAYEYIAAVWSKNGRGPQ